jgi:hypothetical protein
MDQISYKRITVKAQLHKGAAYPLKPYELYAYLEQRGNLSLSSIRFLLPDKEGSLVGAQHYLSSEKIILVIYAVPQGIIKRATAVIWKTGLPTVIDWLNELEKADDIQKRTYQNILLVMCDGSSKILQNTALYL